MSASPPSQLISRLEQDFEMLLERIEDELVAEHRDEILSIWYASPFVKRVCLAQPQWMQDLLKKGELHVDCSTKDYAQRLRVSISHVTSVEDLQQSLRRLRYSAYARIAWRDLQQYASVEQTLMELSAYAQTCIDQSLSWCFEWLKSRPHAGQFEQSLPNDVVVFALGKLGGRELNFSSDVDVVFAYAANPEHTQDQQAKASSFYLKLVQLLIKVLAEQTQDGFVFRVDTRLRPFGNSGALVPSLAAIDQYFQTTGRDWERYAWIRARAIAGDVETGEQFLKDVSPFVYRRYHDYGVMQSLREMKGMVDQKASQAADQDDLKIGQGGIREIEFVAQMFQLIYGGRDPDLRIRSTLGALAYLGGSGRLSGESHAALNRAYLFLRKAENILQMREDLQVQSLPARDPDRLQYAHAMGAESWDEWYAEYQLHTANVSDIFHGLLQTDPTGPDNPPKDLSDFAFVWQQVQDKPSCMDILARYFSEDTGEIYQRLRGFEGSVQQAEPVAKQRLDRFVPVLLQNLSCSTQPVLVLTRFLRILGKIVQRSTYISLLTENQDRLAKLLKLIEASQWVAQYIATHPLLLDELLHTDNYDPPDLEEMQYQLQVLEQLQMLIDASGDDLEAYMERLREFKHAQVLRIAAADIVSDYPIMRVSDHLSWLAETCIKSAVRKAYSDLATKHGTPTCKQDGNVMIPELLIIEYGKLGGLELGYGSDLDVVFVHNSPGTSGETDGDNKMQNTVFFTRVVQRAIHLLTTVTASGKVFDIDTRLRPYGTSGPVVCSLAAYEEYLRNKAWLWEHQALIRARPVTSSRSLADTFLELRQDVLCQVRDREEVRTAVIEMREKIVSGHNARNGARFHLKKDRGGIIDIEFIVQFYVLSYAQKFREICTHTDHVRILDGCAQAGLIGYESAEELKAIYIAYRKHLHQLSLQLLPETAAADKFAEERAIVQNYWTSLLH
ncbi:MAG: bifunctional [glutamate--ammonia ligase]-adenylyl-L-tyrosine phosphorylase/[glutamate--ammonia-ligase] adenylyltransferase [Gammaproteobacteria bacterium]|nr:bifunctional [glutamate--ammonia ligase]-adenylyl-L-tyrosine phosphorylase/[glutamate--ammonia-ligase] adenylyltransferase [Gammaproteobacteria bacterium]